MAEYTVAPASKPQEDFLNAEEDIVFYGRLCRLEQKCSLNNFVDSGEVSVR